MRIILLILVILLAWPNCGLCNEHEHQRLKVDVSIIDETFKSDLKDKGYFFIKYKITNVSRHSQVIDLWTGCTAFNWLSNRDEIFAGVRVCDKNYCSGQLGEYGPGQSVSNALPIRLTKNATPGMLTFRLGYYTCYRDPKIKKNVTWSNPITINIEPWMLTML